MPPSHLRFSTFSTFSTATGRGPCPSYHSYMMEGVVVDDEPLNTEHRPPPSYRPPSVLPPPFIEVGTPLTEANDHRPVHRFPLVNGRGRPYLVLSLLSGASSTKRQPLFFEGDNVEGSVALDLDKEEYIQAIKIAVKGKLITGSAPTPHTLTFLDFSHTVWDRERGDPRSLSLAENTKFDGKLVPGEYTWPFSFPFPSGVTLPGCQASHLPHTFLERDLNGNIQYELVLRIVRSKFRADTKIRTMIAHIPRIIAKPFPPNRQRAYTENTVLLGPDDDAEGWLTLPPYMMRGQVFNNRPAEVKCVLSLAQPLSYTRGTVIPCHLTIMSLDPQTLDLISSSRSIDVRLRRKVNFHLATSGKGQRKSAPTQTLINDVEVAVWRTLPATHGNPESMRRFEGEIHLSKDLQPSSDFFLITIEYYVVHLPFVATGFTALSDEPSFMQPVEIATEHVLGPRPIQYLPREERKDRLRGPVQRGTSEDVDLMTNIGSFNGLLMG